MTTLSTDARRPTVVTSTAIVLWFYAVGAGGTGLLRYWLSHSWRGGADPGSGAVTALEFLLAGVVVALLAAAAIASSSGSRARAVLVPAGAATGLTFAMLGGDSGAFFPFALLALFAGLAVAVRSTAWAAWRAGRTPMAKA